MSNPTYTNVEKGLMVTMGSTLILVGVLAYFVFTSKSNITYAGTTGNNKLTVPDNQAEAFKITDGTQDYLKVTSTTNSDAVEIPQMLTVSKGLVIKPTTTEITASVTLTRSQSGSVFLVNPSGDTTTITLPAAESGIYYHFLYVGSSKTVNITAASTHLYGTYFVGSSTQLISAATTFTLNTTAAAGVSVELYGVDSKHWLIRGHDSNVAESG